MFLDLSLAQLLVVVVSILISLSLHEAMHSYAAYWLGDHTAMEEGRLSINPLKHVDMLTTVALPVVMIMMGLPPILAAKPVPINHYNLRFKDFGPAIVALAGPLTNLILAAVVALFLRVAEASLSLEIIKALILFISINIAFFVFNMIPLPPLDGSRVVYAFAPRVVQKVMEQIESFGLLVIIAFVLILLPIIGPYYLNAMQGIFNFLVL